MRVVAGRFGGRRLTAPSGDTTRPTSDRVREALFSILGPLDGAQVLDLFAGTGALGLEALSRGAAEVLFVEQDRRALTALRANIAALGLSPEEASVRPIDARKAAREARARGAAYDLILLDPPYRQAAALGQQLGADLAALLAPGGRVVTETDRRGPMELAGLPAADQRRYGDTVITIHHA